MRNIKKILFISSSDLPSSYNPKSYKNIALGVDYRLLSVCVSRGSEKLHMLLLCKRPLFPPPSPPIISYTSVLYSTFTRELLDYACSNLNGIFNVKCFTLFLVLSPESKRSQALEYSPSHAALDQLILGFGDTSLNLCMTPLGFSSARTSAIIPTQHCIF